MAGVMTNTGGAVRRPPSNAPFRGRDAFALVCFVLFLYPISIDGVSVNYSFVFFPVALALMTGKVRQPSNTMLFVIAIYALLFAAASLYYLEAIEYWPRRAMSFILFASMFAFAFVSIDERMVRTFVLAIVAVSLYFSIKSITLFAAAGGAELHFEAKDIVGSQRFGFVLVMAFWLVYLWRPKTKAERIGYIGLIIILLSGIALTFSRASIVALVASLFLYAVWIGRRRPSAGHSEVFKRTVLVSFSALLTIYVITAFSPVVFEFFYARLVEFALDPNALMGHLTNEATSEGTRLFIWRSILDFILTEPLWGSGYLGVWALDLFGDASGSAHNQFFDVLFRTGVAGFAVFAFMLFRVARRLYTSHQPLFWGVISCLIYGLFHETFKESHGAFLLAFILAFAEQRNGVGVRRCGPPKLHALAT